MKPDYLEAIRQQTEHLMKCDACGGPRMIAPFGLVCGRDWACGSIVGGGWRCTDRALREAWPDSVMETPPQRDVLAAIGRFTNSPT